MDRASIYRVSRLAPPIMSFLALTVCAIGWVGVRREPASMRDFFAHIYQFCGVAGICAGGEEKSSSLPRPSLL